MSGTIVPQHVADDEARVGSEVAAATQDVLEKSAESMASVGQQLQKARLAKGLSADEVAKALKLSPRQVVAMEDDNWSSLPCNTIIRGFVRNYSRLLGLNADSLMGQLDTLTLPQGPELEVTVGTPVSMPAEGRVDRRDFARVLSGLLVLALAVAAYFFFPQELWLSTLSALKTATQRDEVVVEKAPAEPDAVKAPEAAPVQADAVPAAVQPTAAPPAAAVPAPATTPGVPASAPANTPASTSANVLKFSFAQASWVEVRDRSGQVIFSKKNDAGTAREVEGQPPFAVVIGNAGHVTLQYKGKAVDLSKRSKEDVARLTLE